MTCRGDKIVIAPLRETRLALPAHASKSRILELPMTKNQFPQFVPKQPTRKERIQTKALKENGHYRTPPKSLIYPIHLYLTNLCEFSQSQ